MQATILNLAGEQVDTIELDDSIFGITPNVGVIQRAVLRQQANARQGTHETKTRAAVRGGGRKPYRQKGTGRARQGSTRAPQWAHGGVVFGPHVRSYEQDLPRKARRLAIRSVLSAKAAEGRLVLVDNFADLEPRTKVMKDLLVKLNVGESSALIMLPEHDENLEKASGNLPKVKTQLAQLFSLVDILKHDYLVMPRASVEIVQSILSNQGGRRKLPLVRGGNGTVTTTARVAPAPAPAPAPVTTEEAAPEAPAAGPKARTAKRAPKAEPAADKSVAFAPTAEVADTAEATLEDTNAEATASPKVTRPRSSTTKAATTSPEATEEEGQD